MGKIYMRQLEKKQRYCPTRPQNLLFTVQKKLKFLFSINSLSLAIRYKHYSAFTPTKQLHSERIKKEF